MNAWPGSPLLMPKVSDGEDSAWTAGAYPPRLSTATR